MKTKNIFSRFIYKIIFYVGCAIKGGEISTKKSTNDIIPHGFSFTKEEGSELMKGLLSKKVNQEVVDLRYRMYLVERDSLKYSVNADGNTTMKDPEFTKPNCFEEEDKKVILIQKTEGVTSSFNDIVTVNKDGTKNYKIKEQFILETERESYYPRYPLFDEMTVQIALKKSKVNINDKLLYLDFYIPSYPDGYDTIKRNGVLELSKFYENKKSPLFLDNIISVSFISNYQAWNTTTNIFRKFNILDFQKIEKWSQFYIVQFSVIMIEEKDTLAEFFSENMQKKYTNREKRPNTTLPVNITSHIGAVAYCEKCGKVLSTDDLTIADYRLSKNMYGIGMCIDCLRNLNQENKNNLK